MKSNIAPFITLDPDNLAPLYRQLYDSIRVGILSGRFNPDMKLPASRALADLLAVSRMTVVNAYDLLLAEGYLEARRGSGTFVASRLPEEYLRIPKRSAQEAIRKRSLRKHHLSEFGKNVGRNTFRIYNHHSPGVVVPFQHSVIAAEEFPFELWSKLTHKHLKYSYRQVAGYGEAAGYGPLRKAVAHHLTSTRGVRCVDEQVIITSGTQQAIFLIAMLLLSPGGKAWIEDPCHLGASDVLSAFGASASAIPVDAEGFDIDRAKKEKIPAELIYVTPSRQFPLGMTMSLQRRLNLLEWANENDAWIIEDDYDSEFRYAGRPLPALQGLDNNGRVLYIGTFSKTVFPGLRLACLVVPHDLVDLFTAARSLVDLHSPITDQMVLAEFIAEGHFERHVRRMRTLYRERQATLVSEIDKHIGDGLEVSASDAGMHLVGWLPKGVSDVGVSTACAKAGLSAAPLSRYSSTERDRGGLLLGYTAYNETQIKRGVQKLAKILKEMK